MTGHPGERRNRQVALVTDDLRQYHRLAPLFESHGVQLLGLRPGEEVPETVVALLGGPNDDGRSLPIQADAEATLLGVLQRLDDRPTAALPHGYSHVVFGVDPGATIGLAVVADGQALMVAESLDPTEAVARMKRWQTGLVAAHWSMHVGDGAPEIGQTIMDRAATHLPTIARHLVPEARTTPKSSLTGSRHADAAIHIALRRP